MMKLKDVQKKDQESLCFVTCLSATARPHLDVSENGAVGWHVDHCISNSRLWQVRISRQGCGPLFSASCQHCEWLTGDCVAYLQIYATWKMQVIVFLRTILSPVSIQTQSLALSALRLDGNRVKRKHLLLARFPSKRNASDCVWVETGL